jgi:hypothetical protein
VAAVKLECQAMSDRRAATFEAEFSSNSGSEMATTWNTTKGNQIRLSNAAATATISDALNFSFLKRRTIS